MNPVMIKLPAAATLALLTLAAPAAALQSDVVERYNQAVHHFNRGHIAEASDVLAELIEEHPHYFRGHSLYWDTLQKLVVGDECLDAVRASLSVFDEVPDAERSESFYLQYIKGAGLLNHAGVAKKLRLECIERYPRGTLAQLAHLDEARLAEDPKEAARLWREYIDGFPEEISWCHGAARDRFMLLAAHPDLWSLDEILAAANEFDGLAEAFVKTYGNPTRRLFGLRDIARTYLELDLQQAVIFVERGIVFVLESAPTTEEYDETAIDHVLDPLLEALVRLEEWQSATDTASELLSRPRAKMSAEAKYRALLARGLEGLGDLEPARTELGYASALDGRWKRDLELFHVRHPIDASRQERFAAKVQVFRDQQRERRKAELLAKQEWRRAPPFRLRTIEGPELALSDLRGKVVVLDFWATTCAPCIAELGVLQNEYARRYNEDPKVEFVAISTDTNKSLVGPFAQKRGYTFPVLLTDGSIEQPYGCETTIPQLYVIDPAGMIRFHHEGYLADGFLERLDWMIEAAALPHPNPPRFDR